MTSSWAPEGQDHSTQIGLSLRRTRRGGRPCRQLGERPEGAPETGFHILYPRCFLQPCRGSSKEPLGQVPLAHSFLCQRRPRESAPHRDLPPRLLVVSVPRRCARSLFTGVMFALPTPGAPTPSMVPGRAFPVNLGAPILRPPASLAALGGWLASPGQSWEALLRPDS